MKYIFILFFPLQLFSQQTSILFKNVNIVDVEKGKVVANQNVLVEDNSITKISSTPINKNGALEINGSGKYLMPGLCDFNASVLRYEADGSPAFSLMLANGVTGVRDLRPTYTITEAAKIKDQISDGKILSPRLYLSGKTLVDRQRYLKGREGVSVLVGSPQKAITIVDSMINEGAEVLDIYNVFNRPILKAITSTAHKKGIKVLAWYSGDWMQGSHDGIDGFTHLSTLSRVITKGRDTFFKKAAEEVAQEMSAADYYNKFLPSLGGIDTPYFNLLIKWFSNNEIFLCTGHTSYFQSVKKFEYGNKDRDVFRTSMQKKALDTMIKVQSTVTNSQGDKINLWDLLVAYKRGVKVIAGTQLSFPLTAGMSLHDMLYWLVDGGFTPAESIRTATINPAIFLGKQKVIGTLEEGKLADLILLDANPLIDISNTRKINAVVANGRLLQRKDLDKLLDEAKQKAQISH